MQLADFKAKYVHRVQGDSRQAPFCADQRDDAARESVPMPTLFEEPWHPKAKIVNARITFPFEDIQGSPYIPTVAGIKTDGHVYRFIDDRLYEIDYLFPQSGFAKVYEAMVATYGKPKKETTKEYQNAFGAKFDGGIYIWDNGVSRIMLTERSADLKTSVLMFVHHELEKTAEARRSQLNKPKL